MIYRVYKYDLDFMAMNKTHNTKAKFTDEDHNTSVIVINCLKGGNPINLENCKVDALILDANKEKHLKETLITNLDTAEVTIGIEESMLVVGTNLLQLRIRHNEQVLYSPLMTYEVYDAMGSGKEV